MRMMLKLPLLLPSRGLAGALVLLASGLASCSGGGGGGGNFKIVSCTLGCAGSGAGGDGQVTCGIQDVFVNGDLRVAFDAPVSQASLSVFTVQVTQLGTGKTPAADRFVDPNDPKILVYRPKLAFDSSGSPVFGLSAGASYTVKLPGAVEDPGSDFVRSTGGSPNLHRMLCTVEASLGVLDAKPGSPSVAVTVDQVTSYDPGTGDPLTFALDVPADGAVDVFQLSPITLKFDDLMNPATLVNPVTGESQSVQVMIDPDGIVSDPSDQQEILGTFSILLDQALLTTTVIFTPEIGYPSAGPDPVNKRKIVVHLPSSISDLGGHPLLNSGFVAFTPEVVTFGPTQLKEDFLTTAKEDVLSSGGDWGQQFDGLLLPGVAGGSGRLGFLEVPAGATIVLNTDNEDFSDITDPLIFNPANVLGATFDGTQYVFPPVTDGIFEFATVRLNSGSQLRFEGSNPGRLFVRGEVGVNGRLDVSGGDLGEHDDSEVFGQPGGEAGASGGPGGDGGRLPTWVGFELVAGTVVPDPPAPPPPTLPELNGQTGIGVVDNLINPTGTDLGNGTGGFAWPQPTTAHPELHLPTAPSDITGLELDLFTCGTLMKATVGGGAAFALNGTAGINTPLIGTSQPTAGPTATGGLASDFGLGIGSDPESPQRTLSPEAGYLHGSAGGGGGGASVAFTNTDGLPTLCSVPPAQISNYQQHSGAGGGGGAGALQVQAGSRLIVDGIVDASGGIGGGKIQLGNDPTAAGGGGAGGALLLQGPVVQVSSVPGRIDVSGGYKFSTSTATPDLAVGSQGPIGSFGGLGGAGLLRIETFPNPTLPVLATEAAKYLPKAATLTGFGATINDVFHIAELEVQTVGPGSRSGVQSCWFRPEGNFFLLDFQEDDGETLGWDLKILPNPPSLGAQSYRGENDFFGVSLETLLGNELGVSPLVVRFQGARSVKQVDDLCDVDLAGPNSPILAGSVTGWVEHPAELNDYFGDPALASNMVRFEIIFDRSKPFFGALTGITELTIETLPN